MRDGPSPSASGTGHAIERSRDQAGGRSPRSRPRRGAPLLSLPSGPSFPPVSRIVLIASMTALFTVVAGIIVYPLFATGLFDRYSARGLGYVLCAGSAVSLLIPRRKPWLGIELGRIPALGMLAIGVAAVWTDARLPLLLITSWCYAIAAAVFWQSLADGSSIIERFVGLIHPYKPDFVGPFCRKVTAFWAVFFALHGLVLAYLAATAPLERWEAYTGWIMLPSMLLASAIEYLIRKTWFRYYPYGGPIDRLFSTFFPAENTEMGRRSQEYILARRRELEGGA